MKKTNTRLLAQLGILIAIEIVFALTPLGSLPIGPLVATLAHIPVIVAAIVLGTGAGTFMGFVFGLLSFLVWTFMPPSPLAFVFTPFYSMGEFSGNAWSLVICFVPRILLGLVAALLYKGISYIDKRGYFACAISAIVSTILHSVLVLGGIYIFFGPQYAAANGMGFDLLFGAMATVIGTNGLLEAVLAAVVAIAIAKVIPALTRFKKV
ncbi:MAG: ECF transporter S component [Clostridiales bacterium]|nr:MAG: ECF transporter S component [Clostridiales bacterium]